MDTKALPGVRKAKKKQVKDELDRNKQAEKKKRRLEKALATSAAIRSELEKKKQMKKEEQQRLDEEGAAIAEAVALNVLLGEDSDEPCQIMLKENDGFNHWNHSSNADIFMGGRISGVSHQNIAKAKCSFDGVGWVSNAHGSIYDWNGAGNCAWLPVASRPFARNIRGPFFEDGGRGASEISAGISAAQALSSLQIAEDSDLDTIVFNEMLRG